MTVLLNLALSLANLALLTTIAAYGWQWFITPASGVACPTFWSLLGLILTARLVGAGRDTAAGLASYLGAEWAAWKATPEEKRDEYAHEKLAHEEADAEENAWHELATSLFYLLAWGALYLIHIA